MPCAVAPPRCGGGVGGGTFNSVVFCEAKHNTKRGGVYFFVCEQNTTTAPPGSPREGATAAPETKFQKKLKGCEYSKMDFTVYEYNYILKLIYNEHQNLIRCHADADTLKFISDIEFKLRNIVNA